MWGEIYFIRDQNILPRQSEVIQVHLEDAGWAEEPEPDPCGGRKFMSSRQGCTNQRGRDRERRSSSLTSEKKVRHPYNTPPRRHTLGEVKAWIETAKQKPQEQKGVCLRTQRGRRKTPEAQAIRQNITLIAYNEWFLFNRWYNHRVIHNRQLACLQQEVNSI